MAGPLIAIVGSLDEARVYDPLLTSPSEARVACRELGAALATNQCRIVVYSSESGFIEADVMRGYIESNVAEPGSIQVRYPSDVGIAFPELAANRNLFDLRPDSSPDWEVSFYRSLGDTQGVVLIGGGRSTLVTGLIALAYRLPVAPVAAFGGSARKVWGALTRDKGIATEQEIAAMGQDWHEGSAKQVVGALIAAVQRRADEAQVDQRRAASARRRAALSGFVGVLLLIAAVGTAAISWQWRPGTSGAVAVLMLSPLLAGAAGSIFRGLQDHAREWTATAVLGLGAGAVTFLLFVAGQIAVTPDVLDTDASHRLLVLGLGIALVAGFTFEAVYEKLKTTDVLQTAILEPTGVRGPE